METYVEHYPFVIDWVNSRGATPLHVAAMRGELVIATMLVEYGSDVNAPDLQGNTPLHYATSYGKLQVVKLLVDMDCDVTAINNEGFTASDYSFSFAVLKALKEYSKARAAEVRRLRKEGRDASPESARKLRSGPSSQRVNASTSGLNTPTSAPSTPPLFQRDSTSSVQDFNLTRGSPSQSPDPRASERLSEHISGLSPGRLSTGSASLYRHGVNSNPSSPTIEPNSRPGTPLQHSLSVKRLQRHLSVSSSKSSAPSSPSGSPVPRLARSHTRSKSQSATPTRSARNSFDFAPCRTASVGTAVGTPTTATTGLPVPRTSSLEVPTPVRSESPVSGSASGDSSSANAQTGPSTRANSTFSSPARSRSTSNANPGGSAAPLAPLVATSIRSASLSSGAGPPTSPVYAPGSQLAQLTRKPSWGQRSEEREEDRRRSGILDSEETAPTSRRSRMKRVFGLGRK